MHRSLLDVVTRGLFAAALVLTPALASAQDVTEPALKAAFIYNFAKFTEWPADTLGATEPIAMCVVGDLAVSQALERAVKAHMLAGHTISVSFVVPEAPRGVCHVMYVSGLNATQATKLLAGVRDAPVLTIGDLDRFTEFGGVAQFFFEQGQLRFSIDLASARRARLQISSRLLVLARSK
ncbi:MAG: YfiR family protein [Acidobacteriota bacterium]